MATSTSRLARLALLLPTLRIHLQVLYHLLRGRSLVSVCWAEVFFSCESRHLPKSGCGMLLSSSLAGPARALVFRTCVASRKDVRTWYSPVPVPGLTSASGPK